MSVAAAAVLALGPTAGGARTVVVLKAWDAASFAAALSQAKPGDAIQLAHGTYPKLTVSGRRFSGWVSIFGSRRAVIGGMAFSDSTNLVLSGVTISPTDGTPAVVSIKDSSAIVLDQLLVDGRTEALGARINTDKSDTSVTVENSELTNCGAGARCIAPGANGLNVLGNTFHDCLDCDFIRGGGSNVVIRGNSFNRAIRGDCPGGSDSCNHNDHIQIMGGGPWWIIANRFGERNGGAASVFVSTGVNNTSNRIHDVLIASNLFKGTDTGLFGVEIAAGNSPTAPERVTVTNNTILSGFVSAVRLGTGWDVIPRTEQPVVANNILRLSGEASCGRARFISNLVESGSVCEGNVLGPARLDKGAPTHLSTLVIDKADTAYDYPTDLYDYLRGTEPDLGAIEYRG